jgi:hypothetical protein
MTDIAIEGFSSGRVFRLWHFAVSHSQLLIRSVRGEGDPASKNLDLIFTGVYYMELVEVFAGLEIEKPTDDELLRLQVRSGFKQDTGHKLYVLSSGGYRRYVGAASLRIQENDLAPMQTSLGVL